jgi:3-hydroxyisobutyrate dehydrogenase-like beta-hydroxyacid dehydrogenase
MADRPKLGFIGIGFMGDAITRRLLDRGYETGSILDVR